MELKEFINDNYKNKNRVAENYLFVGTFFIILTILSIFAGGIDFRKFIKIDNLGHWEDVLYFNRIALSFLNSFCHLTLQHALLNMLCFFVCGLYLERKIGSIKFILLILALAFFTSTAISTNEMSLNWKGFSGVNYALYFYIIIDYFFSLKKTERKQHNVIIGACVLALIYFVCCFSGGTTSFSFKVYPYDLISNIGHYTSALTGLIIGLFVRITHMKTIKNGVS